MSTIKTVEVSGFPLPYEATCQRMLWQGIRFLENGLGKKFDPQYRAPKDSFGLCVASNDAARVLDDVIMQGIDDATGAMHHAVVGHLLFIAAHGRAEWLKQFPDDQKYDLDEATLAPVNRPLVEWVAHDGVQPEGTVPPKGGAT